MNRLLLLCSILVLSVGSLLAQPTVTLLTVSSNNMLTAYGTTGSVLYAVNPTALQTAYDAPHFIVKDVAIPAAGGTIKATLDVQEFSIFGPETHFIVTRGSETTEAPLPTVKLYRGKINGDPKSLAYLAINTDGTVNGHLSYNGEQFTISTPQGMTYATTIVPLSSISNIAAQTQCTVDDEKEMQREKAEGKSIGLPFQPEMKPQSVQTVAQSALVAFDADYQCYQAYGSEGAINDYLSEVIGYITTIYENEIDMGLQIGQVHVFASPDPYSGSSLDPLLASFRSYWSANNGSVDRTMAHLLSRKLNQGGASGLAGVDVMCDKQFGYGVTNVTGRTDQAIIDELVIAHELGHNVGSYHTHNCQAYPPDGIDHCVAAEGGCSWTPVQTKGTIMSYCNDKDPTFGPRVIQVLKSKVDAATCLKSLAQMQLQHITLSDTSIVFPPINANSTKDTTISAMIKNSGSVALKINAISFEDNAENNFTLKNAPTFPLTIQPGGTQNLTISFNPKGVGGDITATMRIFHNATGGSTDIHIMGHGAAAHANPLTLSIELGIFNSAKPFDTTIYYLLNDGDAPLQVTGLSIAPGTDPDHEFSLTGSLPPYTINPSDSHAVTIHFTPKTNGAKGPSIRVVSDDGILPTYDISISALVDGLGAQSSLSILNPTIDFGTVSDKNNHDSTFDFVQNIGDVAVHVSKLSISGDVDNEFSIIGNDAPYTLAKNATHPVSVRFKASKEGDKVAYLSLYTDEPFVDSANVLLTASVQNLGVNTTLPAGVSLSISPNPTSGVMNIAMNGLANYIGKSYSIELFDKLGKRVMVLASSKIAASQLQSSWNLPQLTSGSYTVAITLGSEHIFRELIVQ